MYTKLSEAKTNYTSDASWTSKINFRLRNQLLSLMSNCLIATISWRAIQRHYDRASFTCGISLTFVNFVDGEHGLSPGRGQWDVTESHGCGKRKGHRKPRESPKDESESSLLRLGGHTTLPVWLVHENSAEVTWRIYSVWLITWWCQVRETISTEKMNKSFWIYVIYLLISFRANLLALVRL